MRPPPKNYDFIRSLGAFFDTETHFWYVDMPLYNIYYKNIYNFLPVIYKKDHSTPYLTPSSLPRTVWGKNLRTVLLPDQWNKIRNWCYEESGFRCTICGGLGAKGKLDADEEWSFDDEAGIHTLTNVVAKCPLCHLAGHLGRAGMISGENHVAMIVYVVEHVMKINSWTYEQFEEASKRNRNNWKIRSQREWVTDYSWANKMFGFAPKIDAEKAVAKAQERFRKLSLE